LRRQRPRDTHSLPLTAAKRRWKRI